MTTFNNICIYTTLITLWIIFKNTDFWTLTKVYSSFETSEPAIFKYLFMHIVYLALVYNFFYWGLLEHFYLMFVYQKDVEVS